MRRLLATALIAAAPLAAHAWGADGHQAVATLAAALIKGTPAEAHVKALLGDMTLPEVAVWADCARGIDPAHGYTYPKPGKYSSCAPLETPAHIAEMADYVRRNDRQCAPKPGDEICHEQYHYTDIALQRSRYLEGFTGTSDHDIVGAMRTAIAVLQGKPVSGAKAGSAAPISFKSPREALIVLVHLVGDVHQPLHVGSIYLDAAGKPVDPDKTPTTSAEFTVGGNRLNKAMPAAPTGAGPAPVTAFGPPNLHGLWDDVPTSLDEKHVNAVWIAAAQKVRVTAGTPQDWPAVWATGSMAQANALFQGLKFSPRQGTHWTVTLPADYNARMATMKKEQLTLAGARLAQILKAVWPTP